MNFEEFKETMNFIIHHANMLIENVENLKLEDVYEVLINIETEIFHQRIKITRALNEIN